MVMFRSQNPIIDGDIEKCYRKKKTEMTCSLKLHNMWVICSCTAPKMRVPNDPNLTPTELPAKDTKRSSMPAPLVGKTTGYEIHNQRVPAIVPNIHGMWFFTRHFFAMSAALGHMAPWDVVFQHMGWSSCHVLTDSRSIFVSQSWHYYLEVARESWSGTQQWPYQIGHDDLLDAFWWNHHVFD